LGYCIVLALSALDKEERPIIYREPRDNEPPEKGGGAWMTQATRVRALCHAMSGVCSCRWLWARDWVSSWRSVPRHRTSSRATRVHKRETTLSSPLGIAREPRSCLAICLSVVPQ